MAVYTTEVRTICEQMASLVLPDPVSNYDMFEIIEAAEPKIFTFSYPIWEGGDIHSLNQHILEHYYFREIGVETYGLWKAFLRRRLLDIMPYYVKLYPTTILEYDILNDFSITENIERARQEENNENVSGNKLTENNEYRETDTKNTNTSTNVTHTESSATDILEDQNIFSSGDNGESKYSDFPQTPLNPNANYLTNKTQTVNQTMGDNTRNSTTDRHLSEGAETNINQTGTGNIKLEGNDASKTIDNRQITGNRNEGEIIKRRQYGNRGGKAPYELIKGYRDAIINIYPMIINELEDLFMGIY